MNARHILSPLLIALSASAAHAQLMERVDPNTGNYVLVPDPFTRGGPDANASNPNRLKNRVSPSVNAGQGQRSSSPAMDNDSNLTPAQQMAAHASNNAQAATPSVPGETAMGFDTSRGPVSMPGMATFDPTGHNSGDNPLAMPDWWPK